jgi:integrase
MAQQRQTHWQVLDDAGRRKYLTDEERQRFLAVADALPASQRALCYTLAHTGCRISEVLNLRPFHVNVSRRTLTVRTLKRRRTVFRSVPVPGLLVEMLLALAGDEGAPLWTMHRTTAWHAVKRVMHAARVQGPMASCKGLRHGFGIHAVIRGVPPNLIQRWLGHSDSSTTAIYMDAVGVEERAFAQRMWEKV